MTDQYDAGPRRGRAGWLRAFRHATRGLGPTWVLTADCDQMTLANSVLLACVSSATRPATFFLVLTSERDGEKSVFP